MSDEASKIVSKSRKGTIELSEGLEAVRTKISVLKEDRRSVEAACVSFDVAAGRVDAWTESLSKPLAALARRFMQPVCSDPSIVDLPMIMAAAFSDGIRTATLAALYEAYGADVEGLSSEEREAQLAAKREELFKLELAEEAIIRAAEASGLEFLRRADADPRAVLAFDEDLK